MKKALEEAHKAYSTYEVPVGAIIVNNGNIIATGYNMRESLKDPTAHAELIAIKKASQYLGGWRLLNCTMYVTLEPCPMCAGAILNSRIERLVIGAMDKKRGCCGSTMNLLDNSTFNHKVEIVYGVLEDECSTLIKEFFKDLRRNK